MKWILYDIKGWYYVIKLYLYIYIASFLLKINISTKFTNNYQQLILEVNNYLDYGIKSGLQKQSDDFYKNLKTILL